MDLKELAGSKRRAIYDLICTGLGSLEPGVELLWVFPCDYGVCGS